ncbi:ATP synthase F1 subunit delta [Flavihumibacter fluvii]|uniref:ATP synthase F1 subunit delta n=1 Tax=Flavihumibacter fluvii TaxID=2838157 RepID=UPI001BDE0729|nr:ATP synthase F1 subunit delta [Flavihumibacter fluvii]ULQ52509.1 ATP synthase F1 subunit delta [Flavihumibacter fluvii]
MRNSRVANRYSKALMDLAVETKQVEAVKKDIENIRLATTGELNQVLLSPIIRHEKKVQIFSAIFSGKITRLTESFFNLVFAKGREVVLREILVEFDNEYRRMKGIKVLELTTAIPVSESLKADLKQKFEALPRYKGIQMEIEETVDEKILGGFLAQIDDQLFDASIRHDLAVIKKQFVENMYVQKIR